MFFYVTFKKGSKHQNYFLPIIANNKHDANTHAKHLFGSDFAGVAHLNSYSNLITLMQHGFSPITDIYHRLHVFVPSHSLNEANEKNTFNFDICFPLNHGALYKNKRLQTGLHFASLLQPSIHISPYHNIKNVIEYKTNTGDESLFVFNATNAFINKAFKLLFPEIIPGTGKRFIKTEKGKHVKIENIYIETCLLRTTYAIVGKTVEKNIVLFAYDCKKYREKKPLRKTYTIKKYEESAENG